jgi:hypothetical protein
MEIFAGLAVVSLVLVAMIVVVKTFILWLRTRGLPELLLSLYLAAATVLGYPLVITSTRISPSQMWPLHLGSQLIMSVGFACLLLFTLRVFRPRALWAKCMVGLCLLSFAAGGVVYFFELTGENPRPAAELVEINLINSLPIAFAYLWTTLEALSYHRQLKLRLRLGLTEIAVVNRVLLWGLMTLAAGTAVVISLVGMAAGTLLSTPLVVVMSGLGLVHAFCLFLAFHPPRWYSAWLEGLAPASPA